MTTEGFGVIVSVDDTSYKVWRVNKELESFPKATGKEEIGKLLCVSECNSEIKVRDANEKTLITTVESGVLKISCHVHFPPPGFLEKNVNWRGVAWSPQLGKIEYDEVLTKFYNKNHPMKAKVRYDSKSCFGFVIEELFTSPDFWLFFSFAPWLKESSEFKPLDELNKELLPNSHLHRRTQKSPKPRRSECFEGYFVAWCGKQFQNGHVNEPVLWNSKIGFLFLYKHCRKDLVVKFKLGDRLSFRVAQRFINNKKEETVSEDSKSTWFADFVKPVESTHFTPVRTHRSSLGSLILEAKITVDEHFIAVLNGPEEAGKIDHPYFKKIHFITSIVRKHLQKANFLLSPGCVIECLIEPIINAKDIIKSFWKIHQITGLVPAKGTHLVDSLI
ncbi:unnamed protein product [Caenorhabditis auriculariae]|uniref:Uncharacterized protein n=1 Tax=Caenorhabditis auriculariae TaxID=2777116 RepID=A0A8S1GWK1_9PELO|nr:unnamed protein product [Caenorhabditis auriculariae]